MKTAIAFATLLTMATAARAQEQKTPGQRAKQRTERLTTVLELTPEQAAKVEALSLRQAQDMEARRTEQEARREAMRSEVKAKRERYDAEMKAILNADQYAKWQALRDVRTDGQHRRKPQMRKTSQ